MIGKFREPMVIMKGVVTQSASGSSRITWSDEMNIMAQVESLNFTKEVIANKGGGARAIRVVTWYLEELTGMQEELGATYRLRRERNGRTYYYEIVSVQEIIAGERNRSGFYTGGAMTYMFTELGANLIEQRIIEEEAEGFPYTLPLTLA